MDRPNVLELFSLQSFISRVEKASSIEDFFNTNGLTASMHQIVATEPAHEIAGSAPGICCKALDRGL
jgi:hypothetical protein